MATKTFYFDSAAATSPGWFGLFTETSFTAADTLAILTIGKLAIGGYGYLQTVGSTSGGSNSNVNTTTSFIDSKTSPTAGTASGGANTLGDSVRTATTLNGSFASGNWSISVGTRWSGTSGRGRVRMRFWRGVNADGSGATEITSGAIVGSTTAQTINTTTIYTSIFTWAAPAITMTNEYLFCQYEWQEDLNAGSGNTVRFCVRVGTDTTFVTTNWTPASTAAPFTPYRTKHRIRR